MTQVRYALRTLFRVNRSRARTPDSIPPFIRIVKDQPCPYCSSIARAFVGWSGG